MATLEQLKRFEVPEAYQNRANYYACLGDKATKESDGGYHAKNCYKKALRTLEEGREKFPGFGFGAVLSLAGLRLLLGHNAEARFSIANALASTISSGKR